MNANVRNSGSARTNVSNSLGSARVNVSAARQSLPRMYVCGDERHDANFGGVERGVGGEGGVKILSTPVSSFSLPAVSRPASDVFLSTASLLKLPGPEIERAAVAELCQRQNPNPSKNNRIIRDT